MLVALLSGPSAALAVETFSGEYVVSYLGITIGRSTIESRVDDKNFSLESTVSSAGIALIFDSTKGTASATGSFAGERTRPSKFRVDYSEGKRKQMTALGFKGGAVVRNENVPPLKKRGDDWVPVKPAQLKGVSDPLSAGLLRAKSPGEVCGRTIKIFDGEFRLDATLRPAKNPPAVKTYGEGVVTCHVSVKPVAGYRKGRRALDYLENRSKIMVAFAPLGATGVYAPVHATVGTEIGTVTVRARRFDKTN